MAHNLSKNSSDSNQNNDRKSYPFAAIVGQDDLKLCLILCAIDPSIGGVLIRGDKGTAKSTAARGLAKLLPLIKVGYDPESGAKDPCNREEFSPSNNNGQAACADSGSDLIPTAVATGDVRSSFEIPTPFVDLPIGATEDRVLGSIDFSATLKGGGKPIFSPGLLAAANRGILYIDEVNLLPAHLVDVLLDASAMGVNTIQREGLSLAHPAKFILIGTMNPEEGDLRPQLLDRFGLMCDVLAPRDAKIRSEVVQQRMAFEKDPKTFRDRWKATETDLSSRIKAARNLLPEVEVQDGFLLLISTICVEFKVASLRADITLYKTAVALAAWEGRTKVEREHIKRAARWVLAHRKHQNPFDAPPPPPNNSSSPEDDLMDQILNAPPPPKGDGDNQDKNQQQQRQSDDNQSPQSQDDLQESNDYNDTSQTDDNYHQNNNGGDDNNLQTFQASKPHQVKKLQLQKQNINGRAGSGKRNNLPNNLSRVGRYARSVGTDKPVDLALDATLRAAAANGLDPKTGMPIIRPENWRKKVRHATTDTLIWFVVDASGSMSARQRMETVKGAVLALLKDAYQQRDRVGVISFRGAKSDVLLEATNSVELAQKQLKRLPTGGRTPLAHALDLSHQRLQRVLRQDPDQAVLLILLSDGKANVPLPETSGDAWTQTEQKAVELASLAIPILFLDTDAGHVRVGRGKELAELLKADYLVLEDLTADNLVHTIRQVASG